MTYTPPDKVKLLGKEAHLRSTGVVDYYEARMDALPIEATVSRASRTGEVYVVIECGYDGDGQPVAHHDESTTVESVVSWANTKVRELLTEALREIEGQASNKAETAPLTQLRVVDGSEFETIDMWLVTSRGSGPIDPHPVCLDESGELPGIPRIKLWDSSIPASKIIGAVSGEDARKMMGKP